MDTVGVDEARDTQLVASCNTSLRQRYRNGYHEGAFVKQKDPFFATRNTSDVKCESEEEKRQFTWRNCQQELIHKVMADSKWDLSLNCIVFLVTKRILTDF